MIVAFHVNPVSGQKDCIVIEIRIYSTLSDINTGFKLGKFTYFDVFLETFVAIIVTDGPMLACIVLSVIDAGSKTHR